MLEDYASNVERCESAEAVAAVFRSEIERHGYTSSVCRAMLPTRNDAGSSHLYFRNWTADWAKLSDAGCFAASSFIVADARWRIKPFTWLDVRESRSFSTGEQKVWKAAMSWGWNNGFVVPIHGPGYFASVSMASTVRDLNLSATNRVELQMIALLAHERCHALHIDDQMPSPPRMTKRELECLRWVATGKTDWEISTILSISTSTVKYHIDQARRKLGATSRAQAIARLFLTGLY